MQLLQEYPRVSAEFAGFNREWIADDAILYYRFYHTQRATIDICAADISRLLKNWPDYKPWRLLLDLRAPQVVTSAYALYQAREVARLRPAVHGRSAVLINNRVSAQLISFTIRTLSNQHRTRLVFQEEAPAVAWLMETGTMAR
jgi:hypothetical protein